MTTWPDTSSPPLLLGDESGFPRHGYPPCNGNCEQGDACPEFIAAQREALPQKPGVPVPAIVWPLAILAACCAGWLLGWLP